jgi:ribosomal-protein-alanine N-acetyltransferase
VTRTRLLEPGDAERLADLVRRNRSYLAPWEPVRPDIYFTVEGQREVVAESLERYREGLHVPHVILDGSGAVVGRINLNNVVRGAFQSASVGYWVAEDAAGRGVATEALGEMVLVGFNEQRLHRLEAGTVPDNVRSQRVLLHNGFVPFGLARRYLSIAGRWQDHVLFQRLADD